MDSFLLVTAIRRLHHAIRAEIVERLHALGYQDITPSQIYVFQTPGPDGMRPTELARRTLITKQSMNHLLAGLEASGYLDRVDGNGDGRARVLRLTEKGRELTAAIQQIAADIESRWVAAHGPAAIQHLTATLEELEARGSGRSEGAGARGAQQGAPAASEGAAPGE